MASDPFIQLLQRDGWTGRVVSGALPRVPRRAELPTATADYEGCLVRVAGASGTADAFYICDKGDDDAFSWVQLDGGSSSAPLGVVGYAEKTSSQSAISSEVDISGLSVTVTAGANRLLKITAFVHGVIATGSGLATFRLYEGTSQISFFTFTATTANNYTAMATRIRTVDSATVTYKVTAQCSSSLQTSGGTAWPDELIVEDVGAAS